eukprot:6197378-Pleurochrysis_carterae.AAC.2
MRCTDATCAIQLTTSHLVAFNFGPIHRVRMQNGALFEHQRFGALMSLEMSSDPNRLGAVGEGPDCASSPAQTQQHATALCCAL